MTEPNNNSSSRNNNNDKTMQNIGFSSRVMESCNSQINSEAHRQAEASAIAAKHRLPGEEAHGLHRLLSPHHTRVCGEHDSLLGGHLHQLHMLLVVPLRECARRLMIMTGVMINVHYKFTFACCSSVKGLGTQCQPVFRATNKQ